MAKNFNEVATVKKEQEIEAQQTQETQPSKKSKKEQVWQFAKKAAYGVAFIAGAGLVLVLSHLGDKDNKKEEESESDKLAKEILNTDFDTFTDAVQKVAEENEMEVTTF